MAIDMQRTNRRPRSRSWSATQVWAAAAEQACRDACAATLDEPDDDGVHAARKALKQARAALRFLEDTGIEGARSRRHELSRLARRLSHQRDFVVIARLAKKLARKLGGRSRLLAQELATAPHRRKSARWWQSWRHAIKQSADRLGALRRSSLSAKAFAQARECSVRRLCRRACPSGRAGPQEIHEWRKAVVLLRDQLPLLAPPRPAALCERLHSRLNRLAKLLGRFVDGEILLRAAAAKGASGGASEKIALLVRRRQKHALRKARTCWKKVKRTLK